LSALAPEILTICAHLVTSSAVYFANTSGDISQGITLYPGDLIATGTPVGAGLGFKPPKYLKAGDVVRIEIDGIGALENPLV
jgi:2-keto-4-pentenoate hydratase/2-oxohepta-3-ene-1,7-dioic acid hydratase in catechol pathway